MFRTLLPRFHELKGCISDPCARNAYFHGFEDLLQDDVCLEVFRRWEKELQGLDDDAWSYLKGKASRYLETTNPHGRWWEQLFDSLGEAPAYNHLKESVGCSAVRFIPESAKSTPDLEGFLDSGRILCEVKTINRSDKEIEGRSRPKPRVRKVPVNLDGCFFRKLDSTILKAKDQLRAYDTSGDARHLVYINICFDWGPCYTNDYIRQVAQHLSEHPPGVEVEFKIGH
jgi:hypothetical protein